jgi:hypothetical protein
MTYEKRSPLTWTDVAQFGNELITEVLQVAEPTRARARDLATGTFLSASICVPLRINTWCSVRLDSIAWNRNRLRVACGMEGRIVDVPLDKDLVSSLRVFIDEYRHLLLDKDAHDEHYLYPGRNGKLRTPRSTITSLNLILRRKFGVVANVHSLRRIAAERFRRDEC